WEGSQSQLAEWEQKAGDSPVFIAALGRRYSAMKQPDQARGYLERYIRESPETWAFEMLANNYKDQGQTDRWLETLERYLAVGEDHGLDDARIRVAIANHFMDLQQWERARPYAEAAAQSWAEWAMRCASVATRGWRIGTTPSFGSVGRPNVIPVTRPSN